MTSLVSGFDDEAHSNSSSPPLSGTASTASMSETNGESERKPRPQLYRKLTAEAKISEMEKRRTDHLKKCRTIAETFATDGQFVQLDNLLRDQVIKFIQERVLLSFVLVFRMFFSSLFCIRYPSQTIKV